MKMFSKILHILNNRLFEVNVLIYVDIVLQNQFEIWKKMI